MHKIGVIIIGLIFSFIVHEGVFAGVPTPTPFNALSIRLEDPKSPTNQNTFDVVFVTLDIKGRDIEVRCFKQGPGDGAPVQFASQTITGGGNTGVCPITSSIFSTKGDYTISVTAHAGDNDASDSTTVSYNTEGPGDPRDYSKEHVNTCDYKIKFKTADDSGKTVKVEVYRSENTTFTADNGTKVDTIGIGSNTDGFSITTPPSCDKEYYFGIRAFDSAGNGSNVIGDSVVKFTSSSTTTTTTPGAQGAIEVLSGGSILGKETERENSNEGTILGETTPSSTTNEQGQSLGGFIAKNGILVGGIILLIIGAIGLYVSKKKTT